MTAESAVFNLLDSFLTTIAIAVGRGLMLWVCFRRKNTR